MRSLRYSVAVFGLMAVAAPWSMAADYSPKDLLKFRPTQPGVDYDTPDRPGGDRRLQGRDS